jgi:DNA-binding response OmpR family regulator
VDDDVAQQLEPLTGLGLAWYQVDHATTGAEAMAWSSIRRFDAYVLDGAIAEQDISSVCGLIRSVDPDVVIIYLSENEEDRTDALNSGADIFLVKPRETKKLRSTIDDLLDPDRINRYVVT